MFKAMIKRKLRRCATFVMAKGGGLEIGATQRGKSMKIIAMVDRHRLPLSVSTHAVTQGGNTEAGVQCNEYVHDKIPQSAIIGVYPATVQIASVNASSSVVHLR
jgi:hypothetical protein